MNVFHMSTARLAGRPAGLDELTAGAADRRCRSLASTALLGMQEPCHAGTCIPARTDDGVSSCQLELDLDSLSPVCWASGGIYVQ